MMDERIPTDETSRAGTRDWPHAPPHRLGGAGVYFVTARTLDRVRHFDSPARLDLVREALLRLSAQYAWRLEAWAVLNNHYHFVGHSPVAETSAESLQAFLRHLHADITRRLNQLDGISGRKIWHNYRETHLTWQQSYLARLNYTHQNAVHHGLVTQASDYEWCSARAFQKAVTPAWLKTVQSFAYDEIAKDDQDE